MFIIKRDNRLETIDIEKIRRKISYFNNYPFPLTRTNVNLLTDEVANGLYNKMATSEIDEFTARKSIDFSLKDPEYNILGARIIIDNHHRNTITSFKDKMSRLYYRKDNKGVVVPLLNRTFYKFVVANQTEIEQVIDYKRDFVLDYFGFKTLETSYLLKIDKTVIERPQDLFMRVAIALRMNTKNFKDKEAFSNIILTYNLISCKKYTHATPTLFNAGTANQQFSSCFLLGTEDSLEGIQRTLNDSVKISKFGGGVGIHVTNWRSEGSLIRGTNGQSSGIGNFLQMYNEGARAYNQGGKRNGSFAIYLEIYHPDILTFLSLKDPLGDANMRARDLFYALMIPDLFMECVKENKDWYLLDPEECPGLSEVYGSEYKRLYYDYVGKNKARKVISARELWQNVIESQLVSGTPYIIFKDMVNKKNNLKNYGPILSSNLCAEIMLPSSSQEYAVCNLASIVLPSFVCEEKNLSQGNSENILKNIQTISYEPFKNFDSPKFDFKALYEVVRVVTRTMDHLIDITHYPVEKTAISNLFHRPIGIGVSGLADVFIRMRYPFDSEESMDLNKKIFETISFAAYTESLNLVKEINEKSKITRLESQQRSKEIFDLFAKYKMKDELHDDMMKKICSSCSLGFSDNTDKLRQEFKSLPDTIVPDILRLTEGMGVYPSYYVNEKSPISRGEFQWKMWGLEEKDLSGMWDWKKLEEEIKMFDGIRNSLLTANMPTATTAQIMGYNEGIEPYTSNVYRRKVLSGEFVIVNTYLLNDLISLGLWNREIENYLVKYEGNIQNIDGIPDHLKRLYKTVWEISQKVIIDQAADRGPFIDHSQSMNLFLASPTIEQVNNMLSYSFEKKLKTGIYYLKQKAAMQPQKFSIPIDLQEKIKTNVMNKRKIDLIEKIEEMKEDDENTENNKHQKLYDDREENILHVKRKLDINSENMIIIEENVNKYQKMNENNVVIDQVNNIKKDICQRRLPGDTSIECIACGT